MGHHGRVAGVVIPKYAVPRQLYRCTEYRGASLYLRLGLWRCIRTRAGPARCTVIHVRREDDRVYEGSDRRKEGGRAGRLGRHGKRVGNEACETASEVQDIQWCLLRLILRNGMGRADVGRCQWKIRLLNLFDGLHLRSSQICHFGLMVYSVKIDLGTSTSSPSRC